MFLQTTEPIPTFGEKFETWFHALKMQLPNILLALIVIILVFILSRFVRKITVRVIGRKAGNAAIGNVMASFFSIIFIVIGIFVALAILGLNQTVTSLLAGAGILGLVLGLALQDTLSSAVAGIVMTTRKSYKVGDFVESNGFLGTIAEINLRNTTVRQTTGVDVKIPNRLVLNNPLINYSLTGERRVDIAIGISYKEDLQRVEQITRDAIQQHVTYNNKKELEIFFTEFTNTSIKVLVRYWIKKFRQADFLQAQSEGVQAIKNAYDTSGIIIPIYFMPDINAIKTDTP